MPVKIKDLAEKFGMTEKELKSEIKTFGFDISPRAKNIDDELAELIDKELAAGASEAAEPTDKAQVYEEIITQELEREMVKEQRKKTAGKDKESLRKAKEAEELTHLRGKIIEIGDTISVKEFAEKSGINPAKVIGELMKNGILANINQQIDFDTANVLADDLGLQLKKKEGGVDIEGLMTGNIAILLKNENVKDLKPRPPIVSVMGHVDHGKTKLLDYIRHSNVVASEAGGITQHIGAYQVVKNDKKITFLDTPGHEAFTAMRARGAKATDIAILVVAADEGVKPQTIEAINHAKEAKIPIIVAINKIDKEGANPDNVKRQLSELGLQPEDWGGETVIVPISAITGEGIEKLLEMILLVAEIENLKANPKRPAIATVIESILDKSMGPSATVLINTGTLKIMDTILVGEAYGRIKTIKDYMGKRIKEAGPSDAVLIAGLSDIPQVGDILQVLPNEKLARQQAIKIKNIRKLRDSQSQAISVSEIVSRINAGKLKNLKLVLKADLEGSLEAIVQSLNKIKDKDVAVNVIHGGIGNVSESDVLMAAASQGMVLAFNVAVNNQVIKLAEREGVEIISYKIIYKLLEDVTKILSGLIEPEIVEVNIGEARVKQIFLTKKKEMIIGCKVTKGKLESKIKLKIFREDKEIGSGIIDSLRKGNESVNEITEGNECGIKFIGDVSLRDNDVLQGFKEEKHIRSL